VRRPGKREGGEPRVRRRRRSIAGEVVAPLPGTTRVARHEVAEPLAPRARARRRAPPARSRADLHRPEQVPRRATRRARPARPSARTPAAQGPLARGLTRPSVSQATFPAQLDRKHAQDREELPHGGERLQPPQQVAGDGVEDDRRHPGEEDEEQVEQVASARGGRDRTPPERARRARVSRTAARPRPARPRFYGKVAPRPTQLAEHRPFKPGGFRVRFPGASLQRLGD